MAARYRRLWCRAALPALCFCLLGPPAAHAGGFQLTPMLVEVPAGSAIATYTLRNTGAQPLNVQVSAVRWEQVANEDRFAAAKRLLIVPEIVTVAPGQTQLVRVALRGPRPATELNYRLHFDQIPPPPAKGFAGVQIALNMNVPLFFAPRIVTNACEPKLSPGKSDTSVIVTIMNTGSRFLRFSKLVLKNAAGKPLGTLGGPLYVLPGATRHWTLHAAGGRALTRGNQYRLEIVSDGREQGYSLALH